MRSHKLLVVLFLLLVAAWGGNLWYYDLQKLDKPVFLEHYYEQPASLFTYTHLYYIANKDMKRKPFQMELPNGMMLRVRHSVPRAEQGRLALTEVVVGPASTEPPKLAEPFTFDRMRVYYNDGTTDDASIGRITVYPDRTEAGRSRLTSVHSGGGSDGSGSAGYVAQQDVTIAAMKISFEDQLGGTLTAELNGRNALDRSNYPIKLKSGERLELQYRFRLPQDDERRFHSYLLMFRLVDSEGLTVTTHNVYGQPELPSDRLLAYVLKRNGGR